jgi:hypothetical protein
VPGAFDLLAPKAGAVVTGAVDFSWTEDRQALLYKLEIVDTSGTRSSRRCCSRAFNYRPSFLREKATSGVVRWRVKVLDAEGREKRHTEWRELKLKADA